MAGLRHCQWRPHERFDLVNPSPPSAYLGDNEPQPFTSKPKFEDMVGKAQQSVVLILVY